MAIPLDDTNTEAANLSVISLVMFLLMTNISALMVLKAGEQEIGYQINANNHYFKTTISEQNIVQSFIGLRLLIKSADNPSKATREYAIQHNQNLITVFDGKWTTARKWGLKVAGLVK